MAPTGDFWRNSTCANQRVARSARREGRVAHGSQTKKERDSASAPIASGKAMVAIGTHALFQDGVEFNSLGLAVVDEQHRSASPSCVAQRTKRRGSHQLMMSATPIPRTLSLSYLRRSRCVLSSTSCRGRRPVVRSSLPIRVAQSRATHREACGAGGQATGVSADRVVRTACSCRRRSILTRRSAVSFRNSGSDYPRAVEAGRKAQTMADFLRVGSSCWWERP